MMRSDERKVQLSPYKDSTERGDEDLGAKLAGNEFVVLSVSTKLLIK